LGSRALEEVKSGRNDRLALGSGKGKADLSLLDIVDLRDCCARQSITLKMLVGGGAKFGLQSFRNSERLEMDCSY
jgi:hypothetical protein